MTIRIILLLLINLQPLEVQNFLVSKGLKANIQMINLASGLTLGNELNYFNALQAAFNYKGYKHILTSPVMNGKVEYIAGYASSKAQISWSVWNDFNERGEARKAHSLTALAHEIGHVHFRLKDRPHDCTNLMDLAVLSCSNHESLQYSSAQKLKIRFIQKYRRKYF